MVVAAPLEVRVLLAIGEGTPAEVATFPVPLRAVVHKDDSFPSLFIQVDLELMNEGLRAALAEAARMIPEPWDTGADAEERRAEREVTLREFHEAQP